MNVVTLSSQNQITLPVSLGLIGRQRFLVDKNGDQIVLTPVKTTVTEELAGSLNKYIPRDKLGKSWKEIITETKKIAARKIANDY